MGQFMGTHQSKLDAKGRVSIPAPFRTVLRCGASEGPVSIILRPSHMLACVEGWPVPVFESLGEPLQAMPLFSADHEDLSAALFADAYPVESDREGRIVLPEWLARHAGISDAVVFMGQGKSFGIWEPAAAEARRAEARARALARGLTLPGVVSNRIVSPGVVAP
ncbi:MAG: division/cell wall cluster transcriptional repressor MraZ [Rhodospirillales bacterium]